jgi:hypothetical protein
MPTTESKDPLMTLPMLTPCTVCGELHAHRCDSPKPAR